MRFVQFYRNTNKNDILLGIICSKGRSLTELRSDDGFKAKNMIDFIKNIDGIEDLESKLGTLKSENLTDDTITLLPPVMNPEKIIAVGLNYKDHCEEQNKSPPNEPMFFSKFASALVGPKGNVIAHSITNKLDWEVELAVIIGKQARNILPENVNDYIFGYSVAQDISARDWQKERNGGQFLLGKSMDTFCPLGPAIVHKSMISDPQNLNLTCKVNGVTKQDGNTKNMIFNIADIVSRLSRFFTLKPGDVILTGTPGGVGAHHKPQPEFLKPGDIIESEIESIGKITNKVVAG